MESRLDADRHSEGPRWLCVAFPRATVRQRKRAGSGYAGSKAPGVCAATACFCRGRLKGLTEQPTCGSAAVLESPTVAGRLSLGQGKIELLTSWDLDGASVGGLIKSHCHTLISCIPACNGWLDSRYQRHHAISGCTMLPCIR